MFKVCLRLKKLPRAATCIGSQWISLDRSSFTGLAFLASLPLADLGISQQSREWMGNDGNMGRPEKLLMKKHGPIWGAVHSSSPML
jgi:hypothetical protein